jgi:spore cortex formation protein SpoVR/YcgB (stage V sporulation)
MTKAAERARQQARDLHDQQSFNDLWHRTVPKAEAVDDGTWFQFPEEPEENILYFLEKHAPNLEDWKRELLRIVRKVAQYFYPQMLTQKMNEGWATFTHYNMTMKMRERGLVTDGFMLEFLKSHTGVVAQRPYSQQLNPYAIGFAMYNDIKRVATEPTKEDERWFHADWVGSGDWLSATK